MVSGILVLKFAAKSDLSSRANEAANAFQFGGGESRDLLLHFVIYARKFRNPIPAANADEPHTHR
jgi:hypothetical protein